MYNNSCKAKCRLDPIRRSGISGVEQLSVLSTHEGSAGSDHVLDVLDAGILKLVPGLCLTLACTGEL